jgi:hypothetical protein
MSYLDTGRFDAVRIRRENAKVVPIRPVDQVNEATAGQLLGELSDRELDEHVQLLDADHKITRAAYTADATALARALNEQVKRRG